VLSRADAGYDEVVKIVYLKICVHVSVLSPRVFEGHRDMKSPIHEHGLETPRGRRLFVASSTDNLHQQVGTEEVSKQNLRDSVRSNVRRLQRRTLDDVSLADRLLFTAAFPRWSIQAKAYDRLTCTLCLPPATRPSLKPPFAYTLPRPLPL